MPKLISILLFIVLFSSIYQDFPLVNYFGEIARSPIVFLTPLMLFFVFNQKKMKLSKYNKLFFHFILYLFTISLFYILFFYFRVGSLNYFDQNVILKTIKMLIYPIVSAIVYLFIYNYLHQNQHNIKVFAKQTYFMQLIILTILIIEKLQNADGITIFQNWHSSQDVYWRIRLLTFESSWSGSIVIIFSLLPIYFITSGDLKYNKKVVYFTSIFLLILYTILSGSKGYLVLFIIAIIPSSYKVLKKSKYKKYLLTTGMIMLAIGFVVASNLYNEVTKHLFTSISFGTRFTSYATSFYEFMIHPFGVGLGPYMYYYTEGIKDLIQTGFMNNFNLNEIKGYLTTATSLSTKTYFFDNLVFGGLGFLYFFYKFYILRLRKISSYKRFAILKIILIFVILSGMTYITYHIKYEVWIFFALIDFIQNHQTIHTNEDLPNLNRV